MFGFFRNAYAKVVDILSLFESLPPLIFRLVLAYGFYEPAKTKWENIGNVTKYFGEQLKLPYPEVNAYMAAGTEAAGVVLLILGLATRFVSIPLMVVMLVAIKTVHLQAGFPACNCSAPPGLKFGYEIPFYYLIMLFYLLINGAGRFSIDGFFSPPFGGGPKLSGNRVKDSAPYSRSW